MIIKGRARRYDPALAEHLLATESGKKDDDKSKGKSSGGGAVSNEQVTLVGVRGIIARDVRRALEELDAQAAGSLARRTIYHASISPRAEEQLTPLQWRHAVRELERALGLTGQPRIVVRHLKLGREHTHVVWSRVNFVTQKAISDSHNYRIHEATARALEREFKHRYTQGAHVEREGIERPGRTPYPAEMQQGARTGIDPRAVKTEVSEIWQRADSGKAFAAALADRGYVLARGDRRNIVIIDPKNGVHSLARRIEGIKAIDIQAKLKDIDAARLASVAQVRQARAERAARENGTIAERLERARQWHRQRLNRQAAGERKQLLERQSRELAALRKQLPTKSRKQPNLVRRVFSRMKRLVDSIRGTDVQEQQRVQGIRQEIQELKTCHQQERARLVERQKITEQQKQRQFETFAAAYLRAETVKQEAPIFRKPQPQARSYRPYI
jgi:hypothetical protein